MIKNVLDLKKIRKRIIPFCVLWIYIWIVSVLETIIRNADINRIFFFFCGIFGFAVSCLLIVFLSDRIAQIQWQNLTYQRYGIWIAVSVITLLIYEVYHLGQYPGGMSPDSLVQYKQALGRIPYNDWHPVLNTLIFFKLPLVMGGKLGLIVFLQLLYFSLAFGYLIFVMHKCGAPRFFLWIVCFYVWFNPVLATYMMYAWKDIGMTVFATLLIAYYIQIVCSEGVWLKRNRNLCLFSVTAVICGYMRHNAVLFVAPMAGIVLFYSLKDVKVRLKLTFCVIICVISVKILYAVINVEKPTARVLETVGMPLTVWCNVMQKNPNALPEDTVSFMYELASPEAYANNYTSGSFNTIKWSGSIDKEKINGLSYGRVLKYTIQCFWYAPKESFDAFARLTDIVWETSGRYGPAEVTISKNGWDIISSPHHGFQEFVVYAVSFFKSGIGKIVFGSIGFMFFVLLVSGALMFAGNRFSWIHILPLFFYNFGTMLLLSGQDYRFFLFNLPVWLPCLFIVLRDQRNMFAKEF